MTRARAIATLVLWGALAARASAQGGIGGIGAQLPVGGLLQLLFVCVFMVIAFTVLGLAVWVISLPFRAVGKVGESMVGEMRKRQYQAEDEARRKQARLDRFFPSQQSPNFLEMRLEIAGGQATAESLWREYSEAKRGPFAEADFVGRYEAWRRDAAAQLALIETLERSWDKDRDAKLGQTYADALAALESGGDRLQWARTLMRWAGSSAGGASRLDPATAYERALTVLGPESDREDWLRAQRGLGDAMRRKASEISDLAGAAPYLTRATQAYRSVLAALTKADAAYFPLLGDYAHTSLRLGRSGDAQAAGEATRAFGEVLAQTDVARDPAAWAQVTLNLANAIETQGDNIGGAEARVYFERARDLYREALTFWQEQKLSRYERAKRNLTRVEDKLKA